MKQYPSIPHKLQFGNQVYAFDKLDGSNVRAEWTAKKGFVKFGSRRRLLGTDQVFLNGAIELMKSHEQELHEMFKKQRWQKATAYFEFYGPNSFAGHHQDEPHTVTLIDIDVFKRGIIPPMEFLKFVAQTTVPSPNLLWTGKLNQSFVDCVKSGHYQGVTYEGVVCKWKNERSNFPSVFMCKIKTDAWLSRLKDFCAGDEKLYQQLM